LQLQAADVALIVLNPRFYALITRLVPSQKSVDLFLPDLHCWYFIGALQSTQELLPICSSPSHSFRDKSWLGFP